MTDAVRNARAWLARRDVLVAGAIIAVSIAIRLPFVLIPPAPSGLNTVDELALALSVVDRWLGLPPINLCWPGLPLQFFTFVVFAPEFLWSIATDRSLVGLSDTVARHYDDPSSLILTMRLISSIGGAVAALFAYLIVRKLVKDTFAALAAALIVTFLPISMQQSLIGTNDMVAAMAAAYGLISTPAKPILVGLASAAVIATKVPLAVWLVPVFVGGAIFLYQQQGFSISNKVVGRSSPRLLAAWAPASSVSFRLIHICGLSQSDRSRPWSPMFSPTPTAPCPTFGFSQRSFQAESSYSA